jgi:crotonobetainyl-CoA:carnitine CoA-transferase CaiB-like acyl-CoA transferase
MGSSRMVGKQLEMPLSWPCKDGYVNFSVLGGPSGGRTMRNLSDWMEEEGMGDETISDTDWASFDFYGLNTEMVEKVSRPLKKFFSRFTREELFTESIKRGIMLFPVTDADDILGDPNLDQKGFWQDMEYPEYETKITFPRAPFRINDEYISVSRSAPFKGEHNNEVYQELLGIAPADLDELRSRGIL